MTEEVKNENEIKDPEGLLKAYNKAKEDLVELRAENKRLTTELEGTSDDVVNQWKERAIKAEAKNALSEQGIKNSDRIVKYVSLEGVDVDDEGNLVGLDEKLEGIKSDFPELFDVKKRAGRSGADIHEGSPAKRELSPTELQAQAIFG